MKAKEQALYDAIKEYNTAANEKWATVVDAVNDLINDPDYDYNPYSFPPEIERQIETPAQLTGWIYARLEQNSRRDTNKKIRRALGFTYP